SRLRRVDRNGGPAGKRGDNRRDSPQLLFLTNRLCSRPSRFTPNVQNVGPVPKKLFAMPDRGIGIEVPPPIRERVRGDVDDPHELYAAPRAPRQGATGAATLQKDGDTRCLPGWRILKTPA